MSEFKKHWATLNQPVWPRETHSSSFALERIAELRKQAERAASEVASAPETRYSRSPPKYLTTAEAAHHVRLSPRSLERFRVEGNGPSYLKAGPGKRARVFYRLADLDEWLEGRTFTSTSEYDV